MNELTFLCLGYALGTVVTALGMWAAIWDENRTNRKIDRMVARVADHE